MGQIQLDQVWPVGQQVYDRVSRLDHIALNPSGQIPIAIRDFQIIKHTGYTNALNLFYSIIAQRENLTDRLNSSFLSPNIENVEFFFDQMKLYTNWYLSECSTL